MKLWSVMFNFIGVVVILFFMVVLNKDIRENKQQFDELRLKYAVDYATEAAFQTAVTEGNLGINYQDMENPELKGENTLPIFKSVIAMTYDMGITKDTFDMLDNYITSAVLADSTGYYLATMEEVDVEEGSKQGGEYALKWGLKRPYIVERNNGDVAINYHIGKEDWKLARKAGTDVIVETGLTWDDSTLRQYEKQNCDGKTSEECKTNIRANMLLEANKRITQDLNLQIKKRNEEFAHTGIKHQFVYLPATQTEGGVNTISRSSLFITMSGVDFAGLDRIDVQSVGGFTISTKVRTIGFIENGKMFYAYEGQIPKSILDGNSARFFNSVEEAALKGYEPHVLYLQIPLNIKK